MFHPAAPERPRDPGQATVLVAITLVVAAAMAFGLARLGVAALDRERAQTAADAAALAGAADGPGAAGSVAEANDGRLVSYAQEGTDVLVTVEVGSVRASARARAGPPTGAVETGP